MAQPDTGPVGSGQAAVPPDSGDEATQSAVQPRLETALENIDCSPMPPFSCVDQVASRLSDSRRSSPLARRQPPKKIGRDPQCCGLQPIPVRPVVARTPYATAPESH
jgi:hypothetical protein